jgi:DNA-binding NarL/FixJ family response regulator
LAVPIRVVFADDSYLLRESVRQLIESRPELELVAIASDYDSLMAAVQDAKPEVVITDIRMPPSGTDEGIRAAEQIRSSFPGTGVVVLSQYMEPEYAVNLLQNGAAGRAYLLKERISDVEQLVNAVREVAKGGLVIDPRVVEALLAARTHKPQSPLGDLTPRETGCARGIGRGQEQRGDRRRPLPHRKRRGKAHQCHLLQARIAGGQGLPPAG